MHRFLVLAALLAAPAFAADIDGKWTGSIDGPGGPIQLVYDFMADGATLSGSTTGPDGMEIKIANGKIDGNNISFTLNLDFGGQAMSMAVTGVLNGSDLKLTMDFGGMPLEFSLKKS
jgi:opacity protein-like surface antigen